MPSIHKIDKVVQTDKTDSYINGSLHKESASARERSPKLEHIKKRYNDITKSPNDKRLYRGLLLDNEMKVLIISDSTTDKSAAALSVKVGFFNDPDEVPGLAHFCEHMLFLGTEKYPKENDYTMYLSQNGGSSNAVTSSDSTTYYFNVDPEQLSGALDRFSQFFITPLFTEELTELELKAVNSEHQKNIASDAWRIQQIDRLSATPSHPYSKFGTGNRDTLDIIPKQKGINVREKLMEFHQQYYSANLMTLCILGKESLDELEDMVVDMFSEVKNKNVDVPRWPEHPFTEEHFQNVWFIAPIKDIRSLNMIFPLPDLEKYYESMPSHYVSHLLGHEGEGSLLSALKARGWCNSLVAGKSSGGRGFCFFSIIVDLTNEGIEHAFDIVTLTFQYINMIKKEGPIEWIFNEMKDIAEMNFRFKEKSSPQSYVSGLVKALQMYPIEDVLTGEHLYKEWRPDLVNWIMEYLSPKKIRLQVVGKAFEDMTNDVERWYGTKYGLRDVPSDIISNWEEAGLSSDLKFPAKNEFIPTRFDIKLTGEKVDKYPVIVHDTSLIRLWYKQDDEFLVPKAVMTFDFVSPLAYLDPVNHNLTYMFVQLLRDALNEYAYAADLAGLKWELSQTKYGITLIIGGFDDKQIVLLEKIIDKITDFKIDPKRFEVLKDDYIRGLKNFAAEQPYQHAVYYLAVLLAEQVWTKNELLDACSQLTMERVQEFIPQLLSKIHVECLVHGNVTLSEAVKTAQIIKSKLTSSMPEITYLLPKQLVLHREIKLEDGCHFVYQAETDVHKTSCTEVYYQTGLQTTESNMLLELLQQIISEPCFNVLRTKEQLGYIVASGVRRTNGSQGLRIIVQSEKHPRYVEDRIELFMQSMVDYISEMSEEEFDKHKESLASQRLVKPKQLITLSTVFWNEISSQQYNFDRTNIEVDYLRTISRKDLLEYFKDVLNRKLQHKLAVHVISTENGGVVDPEKLKHRGCQEKEKPEDTCPACKEDLYRGSVKVIDDVMAFKVSQSLCPLPEPYNDIPRKGVRSSKL